MVPRGYTSCMQGIVRTRAVFVVGVVACATALELDDHLHAAPVFSLCSGAGGMFLGIEHPDGSVVVEATRFARIVVSSATVAFGEVVVADG